jgi:hypothetical protein
MTDKDRFGDKLRDKERAEEDRYFAEQDRAKLKAIKEGVTEEPHLGLCPRCGKALDEKVYLGVAIDECAACGGIWLDKGELEAVNERADEGWVSRWIRSVLGDET